MAWPLPAWAVQEMPTCCREADQPLTAGLGADLTGSCCPGVGVCFLFEMLSGPQGGHVVGQRWQEPGAMHQDRGPS